MKGGKEALPLINERIRADRVQLITYDGQNVGVVSRFEALRMAQDVGLDLVLIAEVGNENVPVVKIMDLGKALYEKKKKQTEAKKHQKVIQVKEIKLSPKIGDHDYLTKIKQMTQFLEDGKRVKITLFFRGRENALRDEHGTTLFNRINTTLEEHGLLKDTVQEQDTKLGRFWSKIYYLKTAK